MINLLLPVDQQKLRADYRRRWFVVSGFLTLGWLLIVFIIAASLYWFVRFRRADAETALAAIKTDRVAAAIKEQAAAIKEADVLTKSLRVDPLTISPSSVIRRLLDRRGSVTVSEIAYVVPPDGPPALKLAGKSQTRQEFLVYLEALRSDPELVTVDSPVKNLIQEKNFTFTLGITIKSPAPPK
ncbi:MAG: hypothetical protein HYT46_01010 [Candidatus Vogelbacteria bacterium]|nr:hypothetical protein [Candidatus Vogelbacteria bacterium]